MKTIKQFGREYLLRVYGSASATGDGNHNMELSAARASRAAMYAIKEFEKKQKTDPSLQRVALNPEVISIGKSISQFDPLIRRAKNKNQVKTMSLPNQ